MMRSLGGLRLLALVLGTAAATMVACADSEPDTKGPAPADTGTTTLPPASSEAGADADTNADASIEADAAPRVCSDHGFCHTVLPSHQTLEGVWGDGKCTVWAVSTEGNVLRWEGSAWHVHASGLGPLHGIWGSAPTDFWIGGDEGLFHAGGATPSVVAFKPSGPTGRDRYRIHSIWGASGDDVWAVGARQGAFGGPNGTVLHCTADADAGTGPTWVLDPASSNGIAYSRVWGSPASGAWIAGRRPMMGLPFEEVAVLQRSPEASTFSEVPLPGDPGDSPDFGRMSMIHGAAATSDTTMLLLGRSVSTLPGTWHGASTDGGKTFTWTYARDGRIDDPAINAVFGTAPDDAWAVGNFGRVRHWDGTDWSPAAITLTKLPVTARFHSVWSGGPSDVWLVGQGMALRYDPAMRKDGGTK